LSFSVMYEAAFHREPRLPQQHDIGNSSSHMVPSTIRFTGQPKRALLRSVHHRDGKGPHSPLAIGELLSGHASDNPPRAWTEQGHFLLCGPASCLPTFAVRFLSRELARALSHREGALMWNDPLQFLAVRNGHSSIPSSLVRAYTRFIPSVSPCISLRLTHFIAVLTGLITCINTAPESHDIWRIINYHSYSIISSDSISIRLTCRYRPLVPRSYLCSMSANTLL